MALSLAIFGVISIIVLVYYFLQRKFNYWADRGIPFVKPEIPFGNLRGVGSKISAGQIWAKCYNEMKGKAPMGGIYMFTEPALLALDLDLLRSVFVKDFEHFRDRGAYVNEKDDPLSAHLFSITGEKWRNLRTKLSPTFTSGKMKMMYPTILATAKIFNDHLKDLTRSGQEVEFRELLAQFTTDVIGSAAFGIECNTMKDPDNEFRTAGRKIFEPSLIQTIKIFFVVQFPDFARRLRITFNQPFVIKFFLKLLRDIVNYREKNDVKRNDFMSLLLQIKNSGRLDGEDTELGKITFEELAAQVFLFFIAGFETSSSTMSFAFYELALNPEIQERARQEVKEVLERHGGELTYEAAMELHYLDQIIHETLRKYPVVDTLFRKVTIPYKVPGSHLVLDEGKVIMIPVLGIHRDPDIYPEPEKFDPERFTKENIASRHPYAWLPFGQGPRNCIGLRFGMMQTRLGIATVLSNFRVSPAKDTTIPLKLSPGTFVMAPVGGMPLKLQSLLENDE